MSDWWEKYPLASPEDARAAGKALGRGSVQEKELTPAFAAKQLLQGTSRLDALGRGMLNRNDPRSAISEYAGSLTGLGAPGRFDSASIGLLPFAKKLSRAKGEGAQSDAEGRDYKALLPNMRETDAINKDRIAALRQLATSVLQELGEDVPAAPSSTPAGDPSLDDLIAEYQRRRSR